MRQHWLARLRELAVVNNVIRGKKRLNLNVLFIFFYLKRWFFFYLPTVSYIIAVYYIGKTVARSVAEDSAAVAPTTVILVKCGSTCGARLYSARRNELGLLRGGGRGGSSPAGRSGRGETIAMLRRRRGGGRGEKAAPAEGRAFRLWVQPSPSDQSETVDFSCTRVQHVKPCPYTTTSQYHTARTPCHNTSRPCTLYINLDCVTSHGTLKIPIFHHRIIILV